MYTVAIQASAYVYNELFRLFRDKSLCGTDSGKWKSGTVGGGGGGGGGPFGRYAIMITKQSIDNKTKHNTGP